MYIELWRGRGLIGLQGIGLDGQCGIPAIMFTPHTPLLAGSANMSSGGVVASTSILTKSVVFTCA